MKTFALFGAVALFAVTAGCRDEGDEYTFYNTTTTCDASQELPQEPPPVVNYDPVWQFNAQYFKSQTARWQDGDIRIWFPNADAGELGLLQGLIDEINPLIGPACRMIIVGDYEYKRGNGNGNGNGHHRDEADIEVVKNSFVGEFGTGTTERFSTDGKYTFQKTVIHLAHGWSDSRNRGNELKQELIHSLGFFGYTKNDGLMDPTAPSGIITDMVRYVLQTLYAFPPGSVPFKG